MQKGERCDGVALCVCVKNIRIPSVEKDIFRLQPQVPGPSYLRRRSYLRSFPAELPDNFLERGTDVVQLIENISRWHNFLASQ